MIGKGGGKAAQAGGGSRGAAGAGGGDQQQQGESGHTCQILFNVHRRSRSADSLNQCCGSGSVLDPYSGVLWIK